MDPGKIGPYLERPGAVFVAEKNGFEARREPILTVLLALSTLGRRGAVIHFPKSPNPEPVTKSSYDDFVLNQNTVNIPTGHPVLVDGP